MHCVCIELSNFSLLEHTASIKGHRKIFTFIRFLLRQLDDIIFGVKKVISMCPNCVKRALDIPTLYVVFEGLGGVGREFGHSPSNSAHWI